MTNPELITAQIFTTQAMALLNEEYWQNPGKKSRILEPETIPSTLKHIIGLLNIPLDSDAKFELFYGHGSARGVPRGMHFCLEWSSNGIYEHGYLEIAPDDNQPYTIEAVSIATVANLEADEREKIIQGILTDPNLQARILGECSTLLVEHKVSLTI